MKSRCFSLPCIGGYGRNVIQYLEMQLNEPLSVPRPEDGDVDY